jgi:hypothetical protein
MEGSMEVEFTARQVKISKVLKSGAEEGIERIALVLGRDYLSGAYVSGGTAFADC